ncbi:Na+/H+ antiporter NhaC, partial [Tsukamurella conjunctivitidis]
IVASIVRLAKTTKSLIIATVTTCITGNIVGCDQYMSIIVPGRMYAEEYRKRGIKGKVLSRTLEDSGTMTSPLIPWNTCGAFMATTLGVATFDYLPYTFLCLLSPVIAIAYALTGYTIEYYEDGEAPKKVRRFRMPKRI